MAAEFYADNKRVSSLRPCRSCALCPLIQPIPAAQIHPKFSQIQPSPAKSGQENQRKKLGFSLDFLCRFEPFLGLALTPRAKKSFLPFLGRLKHFGTVQIATKQAGENAVPSPSLAITSVMASRL
jgi:hypothetical protein